MPNLTIPTFVIGLLPVICNAATVSTFAEATSIFVGGATNSVDFDNFDAAVDVSGFTVANAPAAIDVGTANATSAYDDEGRYLIASANSLKKAGTSPSAHFAYASTASYRSTDAVDA